MDIIEPVAPPAPKPERSNPSEPQGNVPSVARIKAQEFFGVQTPNQVESDILNDMVRLLDGDNKDPIDFLWEIKNLENRIGTPPLGVSRMQHIHNFVKLNSQINKLERERDLYGT